MSQNIVSVPGNPGDHDRFLPIGIDRVGPGFRVCTGSKVHSAWLLTYHAHGHVCRMQLHRLRTLLYMRRNVHARQHAVHMPPRRPCKYAHRAYRSRRDAPIRELTHSWLRCKYRRNRDLSMHNSPPTLANVSRSTCLGSMDGFFTCLDTGLQVILVTRRSLHMVLLSRFKNKMILTRSQG